MKRISIFVLAVVMTGTFAVSAEADKISDAKKDKAKIQNKIVDIQKQKNIERRKLVAANARKKSLIEAQQAKNKEIKNLENQISALNQNLKEIDNAIEKAQEDYNQQLDLLKTRLVVMYQNSSTAYLESLFESKDIMELLEKFKLISMVSKNDKELIDTIIEMKQDIEIKKDMKLREKRQKGEQVKSKMRDLQFLSATRTEIEGSIHEINESLDKLEAKENEMIKQAEALNAIIRSLSNGNRKYAGGLMRWPVPSSTLITSQFGMRVHPILHKLKMHTGIDIATPEGKSILAANSGRVILSKRYYGYGNAIIIDHGGGIATLYGHCSKLLVTVGDIVKAGEVIGKIGTTGLSTNPHLHFEVRVNGKMVNPLKYVSP